MATPWRKVQAEFAEHAQHAQEQAAELDLQRLRMLPEVLVMMSRLTRSGEPKLVLDWTYLLTGVACVSRIYTHHAALSMAGNGVFVNETFGTTLSELRQRLDIPLAGFRR